MTSRVILCLVVIVTACAPQGNSHDDSLAGIRLRQSMALDRLEQLMTESTLFPHAKESDIATCKSQVAGITGISRLDARTECLNAANLRAQGR